MKINRAIRSVALLIALLLIAASSAYASEIEIPRIADTLFDSAKQALFYLSSGEYERLVTLLPFSDVAPSAKEWQNFVEGNFKSLVDVQTEYSVSYWSGEFWSLAVPASNPDSDDVEALVLTSEDGETFSGCCYAIWKDVKEDYEASAYVVWNKEFVDGLPQLTVD